MIKWIHTPNLLCVSSTVSDNNMDFRFADPTLVLESRQKLFNQLNLSMDSCIAMSVEHDTKIHVVEAKNKGLGMYKADGISADALITNIPNISLMLLTADCLPILIYEQIQGVIALIHGSWSCLDKGILELTFQRLKASFGVVSSDCNVFIGPGISKDSYIKFQPSQVNQLKWKPFLELTKPDTYKIDLMGFVFSVLTNYSIDLTKVHYCGVDTATSEQFFSHIRSSITGEPQARFATIASLL